MHQVYNCIIVFNKAKDAALFCTRQKDPYKGLYNFVGGKVEQGEDSTAAAYRELYEETGITRRQIRLYRLMDIRYYYQDFDLELYVGKLDEDVSLKEEANPLLWLPLGEDFTDKDRFAGEQNIAHIMNVANMYPIPERCFTQDGLYIGVDGCKGGWIAAVLDHGELRLERYDSVDSVVEKYPSFDAFLIDMAVGLRNNQDQVRPDDDVRKELGIKGSSVFPIPSRDAVYAEGEEALQRATLLTNEFLSERISADVGRELLDICDLHESLHGAMENLRGVMEDYRSLEEKSFAPVEEAYDSLTHVGQILTARDAYLRELLLSRATIVYGQMRQRYGLFLLLFVLSFLCLTLESSRQIRSISRRITMPVATLIRKASLVGQGELQKGQEEKMPPGADEDIQRLGEIFDEMAGKLTIQFDTLAENARIREELKETRFKELQMQINPHFLFNTLNMISETAYLENADETVLLLQSAARMFRYSLDFSGKEVPLFQEIEELGNYIFLQERRFGKRIRFCFDLDESFHSVKIPALTLEPLVENAIVHGIGLRRTGNEIHIRTRKDEKEGQGILEIWDNGSGMGEEKARHVKELISSFRGDGPRIGIGNVSSRLRHFYKGRAFMELETAEGKGTLVRITLPLNEDEKEK